MSPTGKSAGVVIAGAGQGGFQVAASLRTEGYEGSITLIGDEPGRPYQRPPLSKAFMAGKLDVEATHLRPEAFYQDQRINLMMGQRIARIEPSNHRVLLASGGQVPYRQLVLATGARNRRLPVPGAGLEGVCYLRTRDEAIDIRHRLGDARAAMAAVRRWGRQCECARAIPRRFIIATATRLREPRTSCSSLAMARAMPAVGDRGVATDEHRPAPGVARRKWV